MAKYKLTEANEDLKLYREKGKAIALKSYSPYSKFKVGSVVVANNQKIYLGTNIENASYSLCMCAERNAIYQAVLDGQTQFVTIVIYIQGSQFAHPCGACLQVMTEFMPLDGRVFIFNDSEEYISEPLSFFIPHPFDRSILLDQ